MSTQRPTEHGGGGGEQAIVGDIGSFPPDAELARSLAATARVGTLSTLTSSGYPYGSVVSFADDGGGCPMVLISEMAEHTVNARADERVSMLIVDDRGDGDPLGRARLTMVGRLGQISDDASSSVRDRYLDRHPYAAHYVDFTDFAFWRLAVESVRYVGGFGHMSWVSGASYQAAVVDPVFAGAESIIEHMNDDHRDANLAYVQVLAGVADATDAEMTGIDRRGISLVAATPSGARMTRIAFDNELTSLEDARPAVIALLRKAEQVRA